jgi:hypothetical protein
MTSSTPAHIAADKNQIRYPKPARGEEERIAAVLRAGMEPGENGFDGPSPIVTGETILSYEDALDVFKHYFIGSEDMVRGWGLSLAGHFARAAGRLIAEKGNAWTPKDFAAEAGKQWSPFYPSEQPELGKLYNMHAIGGERVERLLSWCEREASGTGEILGE